jgi:hypothetical protein
MATGRIGVTPVLRVRWSDQPTAGTTALSGLDDNSVALVYDAGYEAVYRNGVLLSRGNDYTATDGTTVTLTEATITGDIIEIFANDLVPLTDAISKGQYNAKGALLSATAASTPGVLAVGTNAQVLTADSTTSTGLAWATPAAAGGMTLLSTTNLTTTTTAITGISQDYTNLMIVVAGISIPTAQRLEIEFRSTTNARIVYAAGANQTGATTRNGVTSLDVWDANITATDTRNMCVAKIDNYADATRRKGFQIYGATNDGGSYINLAGAIDNTAALNAFFVDCNAVPTAGTVQIWGIK